MVSILDSSSFDATPNVQAMTHRTAAFSVHLGGGVQNISTAPPHHEGTPPAAGAEVNHMKVSWSAIYSGQARASSLERWS